MAVSREDTKRFAQLLFQAGESYDQVVEHFATQWQMSKSKARESLRDLGYQPPPTDAQRRRAGAGVDREAKKREQEDRRANKKQMDATLRAFGEREREEAAQKKKEEKAAERTKARLERERARHEEATRKNSMRYIVGDEIKRTIKSNVIQFLGEFGIIGRIATRRMYGSRYRDQHETPRGGRRDPASPSVDAQATTPVVSSLQLLTRRVDHAGARIVVALTDVRHEIEKTAKRMSRPAAANSLGASVYAEKYGATGMGMGADKSALFRMMTGGKMKAALGIASIAGLGALALSSTPAHGALHPSDDMAHDKQPPQALPPDQPPPQALPPHQPGVEQKDTGAVSDRADELKYESREIKFEADTIEFEQTGISPGAAEGDTSATPTQAPPAVGGGATPSESPSPSQAAPSAPPATAVPTPIPAVPSAGGGQAPQADAPSVSSSSRPPMTGTAAATGDRGLFGSNPAMIPPSSTRMDTSRTGARDAFSDQLKQEGGQYQDPKAVASAFIGNAVQESGLNPRLSHDSGTGYGLFGHRLERRDAMFKWLQENGYSRDSAEGQARYAAHEFQTSKEFAGLRQRAETITGRDVPDFARDVSRAYERPNPRWANEERRAREAASTYDADEKTRPQASRDDVSAKTRSDVLTPEALTRSARDSFSQRFGEEPLESLKSRLDAAMLDTERSPASRHPEWTVGDLRKTPGAEPAEPSKKWSMEDRFVGGEDPPPPTSKRDAFDSGSFPGLGKAQVDPHHGIGQ